MIFVCVFYRLVFFFGLVSLTKEQRVTGWEPPPPPPGVPYFSVVVGFFLISTNRSAQLLAVTRISNDAIDPGMVVHGISFLIFQSAVYNTKLEVKKRKKSYSLPYVCCCLASRISSSPLALFFPHWEENNSIWWGGAPMRSKGFPGPSNFTFLLSLVSG